MKMRNVLEPHKKAIQWFLNNWAHGWNNPGFIYYEISMRKCVLRRCFACRTQKNPFFYRKIPNHIFLQLSASSKWTVFWSFRMTRNKASFRSVTKGRRCSLACGRGNFLPHHAPHLTRDSLPLLLWPVPAWHQSLVKRKYLFQLEQNILLALAAGLTEQVKEELRSFWLFLLS